LKSKARGFLPNRHFATGGRGGREAIRPDYTGDGYWVVPTECAERPTGHRRRPGSIGRRANLRRRPHRRVSADSPSCDDGPPPEPTCGPGYTFCGPDCCLDGQCSDGRCCEPGIAPCLGGVVILPSAASGMAAVLAAALLSVTAVKPAMWSVSSIAALPWANAATVNAVPESVTGKNSAAYGRTGASPPVRAARREPCAAAPPAVSQQRPAVMAFPSIPAPGFTAETRS
jgi:hypothetical protein